MKGTKIIQTEPRLAPLFIRIAVGLIFLSEGIQKFIFPAELGSGRFLKIGIPLPEFFGPFVGVLEIFGGCLILLGLYTRIAASWLFIIMCVAILSTKLTALPDRGFWAVAHDARTDFSMLFSTLFLIVVGGGKKSIDHKLQSL